jgi:exodeoxyribonuclease VII large subunit
VLARGFALVRDARGQPVRAAASVAQGVHLSLEFADGRVGVTADGDRPAASPARKSPPSSSGTAKPATKRATKSDQGSLF